MTLTLTNTDTEPLMAVPAENLDAAAAPALRAEMLRIIQQGRPLRVDMSAVRFADTSGIGALVSVAAAAAAAKVSFRLQGVSARLAQSLSRAPTLPPLWSTPDLVLSRGIA